MPRPSTTQRGKDCRLASGAQLAQFPYLGAHVAPLFPQAHTQASSQPGIQLREWTVVLREPEVVQPASDILVELVDTVGQRDAPASPGELTQPMAKILESLLGPIDARAMEGKA